MENNSNEALSLHQDLLASLVERTSSSELWAGRPTSIDLIEAHFEWLLSAFEPGGVSLPALERRVGVGKFLAIGTLTSAGLGIAAGFLLHPAAVAGPALRLRKLLYLDRTLRPRIVTLYAELSGPDAVVFEAIHDLSLRVLVTDYDALAVGHFESAFGRVAPSMEDLQNHVSRSLDAVEVGNAVIRLRERGILRTESGHVWIRF
jgi:hypothetical protein